jgi:hypothetical protein
MDQIAALKWVAKEGLRRAACDLFIENLSKK